MYEKRKLQLSFNMNKKSWKILPRKNLPFFLHTYLTSQLRQCRLAGLRVNYAGLQKFSN